MTDIKEFVGEDYVHSSNALFHFMTSPKYMIDALKRKALCPRYCDEDVRYLNIILDGHKFEKVAVLQKCFCDIPLHNVIRKFPIKLVNSDNLTDDKRVKLPKEFSHPDLYGEYALAFSKKWGEHNKLQPVYYLNEEADITLQFSKMLQNILKEKDLSDRVSDTLLNWMCFLKPLRGSMKRNFKANNENITFEMYKNFHDEHEWRYVPFGVKMNGQELDCLIANRNVRSAYLRLLSDRLQQEDEFQLFWLPFQYDELRYIIVPDKTGRLEIIRAIQNLSDDLFDKEDIDLQKAILISKSTCLRKPFKHHTE